MRIAVASDHAGFALKEALRRQLEEVGHVVDDRGTHSLERTDYPPFAADAGRRVAAGEADLGVLCCGSGLGVAIAAGKVAGVRAVTARSEWDAELARRHNDANVVCLGERVTAPAYAWAIVERFLSTPFEGGRHADRVRQIAEIEQ